MVKLIEFAVNDPVPFIIICILIGMLLGVIVCFVYLSYITSPNKFINDLNAMPKTTFNEMCSNCFSERLSEMSNSDVCSLAKVELMRRSGCEHGKIYSAGYPPPPTTEYPKTEVMPCGHYNIGCTEYMCNDG